MATAMTKEQGAEAYRNGTEIESRMISDTKREVVIWTHVRAQSFYCLITLNQYNVVEEPCWTFEHKNISAMIFKRHEK